MSKVKYRVREFTPKANQGGTHSFFAEAVISTDIDTLLGRYGFQRDKDYHF